MNPKQQASGTQVIDEIVEKMVDEIVDEIDLLVLNAKIEAAQVAEDALEKSRRLAGKERINGDDRSNRLEELSGF